MNTFTHQPPREKKKSFISHLAEYKFDFTIDNSLAIKYIPYFVFLTFLGLIYIANNYYSDRLMRNINSVSKDVDVLRVEYSTLKYEYISSSKQSEIAKKVKSLGLVENNDPVVKIKVED